MLREVMTIDTEVSGSLYSGYYAVMSDMLTVWIPSVGSRTTRLGGRVPENAAKDLLGEVVRECRHLSYAFPISSSRARRVDEVGAWT